jgi:hypothetical protein
VSWNETSLVAPKNALSPAYPKAGCVVYDSSKPCAVVGQALDYIAEVLDRNYGVRAWLGWTGDDGFVRVIARLPPFPRKAR